MLFSFQTVATRTAQPVTSEVYFCHQLRLLSMEISNISSLFPINAKTKIMSFRNWVEQEKIACRHASLVMWAKLGGNTDLGQRVYFTVNHDYFTPDNYSHIYPQYSNKQDIQISQRLNVVSTPKNSTKVQNHGWQWLIIENSTMKCCNVWLVC